VEVVERGWRVRWMIKGLGIAVEERVNVRLMAGMVSVEQKSHNCFIDTEISFVEVEEWNARE
jgi:hypothetical protein